MNGYIGIVQTKDINEAMKVAQECIESGRPFYCRRVQMYDPSSFTPDELIELGRDHAPVEYEVYADLKSTVFLLRREADILRLKEIREHIFNLIKEAHGIAEKHQLGDKADTWFSGIIVQLGVDYADATDYRDHPNMHSITDTIDELEEPQQVRL
jgi:hypothetical protein